MRNKLAPCMVNFHKDLQYMLLITDFKGSPLKFCNQLTVQSKRYISVDVSSDNYKQASSLQIMSHITIRPPICNRCRITTLQMVFLLRSIKITAMIITNLVNTIIYTPLIVTTMHLVKHVQQGNGCKLQLPAQSNYIDYGASV